MKKPSGEQKSSDSFFSIKNFVEIRSLLWGERGTEPEPRDLLRSWVIRFWEPALLNQTFFAPYTADLANLPEEITDRGRDVWGRKRSAVQHVRELNN